jgi:tetratricopeptide (TPR) repeat protein
MPQKKNQKSSQKQHKAPEILGEESALVEQQLEQYQQLARHLRAGERSAEEILSPITAMTEAAQISFLKALAKENTSQAADVALALHNFAPLKEARKEARRTLIKLEAGRTYPQWAPPVVSLMSMLVDSGLEPDLDELLTPARFWRGMVSNTRDVGEVQLILLWEQGPYYRDARIMGFLLDFMGGGVKDFFTDVSRKPSMEERVREIAARLIDLDFVDCSLAKGQSLVREALAVNQRTGIAPHKDYQRHLPLVRQLVLDVEAGEIGEDEKDDVEGPDTILSRFTEEFLQKREALDVVPLFFEAWKDEEYGEMYDRLASDSPLREGLSREAWIERRQQWSAQAHSGDLSIAFLEERKDSFETEAPEIEVGWSLVFSDSAGTLPEIPMATAFYEETGRHWFWASFKLVEEDEEWRIQSMTDEGAEAFHLSRRALEQRLKELEELASQRLSEIDREMREDLEDDEDEDEDEEELDEGDSDLGALEFEEWMDRFSEAIAATTRCMHYCDALIAQSSPGDISNYNLAYDQALGMNDPQRAAVYAELMVDRFPAQRAESLHKLATAQLTISRSYDTDEDADEEQMQRFMELAEQTFRSAIAVDTGPMSKILLANILVAQNKQIEEAEDLLHQAEGMATEPKEVSMLEGGLATLALERDDEEAALRHYQRAAEVSPDMPNIWYYVGSLQNRLHRVDEAVESFRRSIEQEPGVTAAYIELADIYIHERRDLDKAQEIVEEGLEVNPDAADLLATLAMVHIEGDDLDSARQCLEEAEDIDDELEIVQTVRRIYDAKKAERRSLFKFKSKRHKKKRR